MRLFFGSELGQRVDDRPEIGAAVAKEIFDPAGAQDFQVGLADGLDGNSDGFVRLHGMAPVWVSDDLYRTSWRLSAMARLGRLAPAAAVKRLWTN
jgi:hypothetical protein